MTDLTTAVRKRLWFALSPDISNLIGLTPMQLQQAAIGSLQLNAQQVATLARAFNIKDQK